MKHELHKPSFVSELLASRGLRLRKSMGQHFVVDANIIAMTLRAADLKRNDFVIEIGAGIGTLTRATAEKCARVYAVEADRGIAKVLREMTEDLENVRVIEADAMKLSFDEIVAGKGDAQRLLIVSNLPYKISIPVMLKAFRETRQISEAVVMVQKEACGRICAEPGSSLYSAVSVKFSLLAERQKIADISRNVFFPRPDIESALLKMRRKGDAPEADDPIWSLIEASFSKRRKMLKNALLEHFDMNRSDLGKCMRLAGISPDMRAEDLSSEDFKNLSSRAQELRGKK